MIHQFLVNDDNVPFDSLYYIDIVNQYSTFVTVFQLENGKNCRNFMNGVYLFAVHLNVLKLLNNTFCSQRNREQCLDTSPSSGTFIGFQSSSIMKRRTFIKTFRFETRIHIFFYNLTFWSTCYEIWHVQISMITLVLPRL